MSLGMIRNVLIVLKTKQTKHQIKYLIPANQVVSGDCYIQDNLRIFSKFSDRIEDMPGIKKIVELTKFKLKNINISYE
jgi:hypothetical protein